MKRFDKGYIYSSLLSDLFGSLVILFIFLRDFFLNEDANPEDIIAAIPFFAVVFSVIYICLIIYRIVYYRTSGYELTETEIKCNRGVLFKKCSVLDYKKVHAINKRQNLFQRMFGIAVLTVDSGSTNTSHQAEITIIEKERTVDLLLNDLNSLKEYGTRSDVKIRTNDEVIFSDKDSLYCFTSKKKILYTLINIASTAFFTFLFGALAILVISLCKLMLQQDFLGTWGQYFLYAILITVGAMLLFSMFSLIGCLIHSFVGYYDFTIHKRGKDIQISYGLLEKHTNTFGYDRIKAVKISQSLVQRILGFAVIKLEVIGYTSEAGNDSNTEIGVLVPFCKYDEVGEILGKILPDYLPDIKQTQAVSFFPFVSWFMFILSIVFGVIMLQAFATMVVFEVSCTTIVMVAWALLVAGAVVLGVKLVSAALNYQNNGLAISNGKVTAYYGGFTKNITVFMNKNLIAAEDVTTPLRQKAGIVSLVMHLKTNALSNEIKVHIQKEELSEKLENLLIL